MSESVNNKGPYSMGESFKQKKKEAVKAAKGLGYGDRIVNALDAATSAGEIERIMINARHAMFGD